MKKSELIKLIRENYKNLSLKESKNKKKAVPYKSAKEIMDGIHEEAEAENQDSKASKIEQEIESIHSEIQNLYSSTVAGNVDSISNDIKYLLKQKEELEKELESLTGKKLDSDTEDIVTDTETDSSIEQNPKTSGKSNQDENKTPNPVNILNSLDKDHSPALLRIALKYAESHKDQFGDKIETIKNKLKSPEINKDDLNENDLIRLLQRRAGLI
jgi:citrate lyase gamma subunit